LRAKGAELDELILKLTEENDKRCQPPIDPSEITAIAKSNKGVVRLSLTQQKIAKPGTSPTQHKALSILKVNCFFVV
jgi:hypothetical protein